MNEYIILPMKNKLCERKRIHTPIIYMPTTQEALPLWICALLQRIEEFYIYQILQMVVYIR